MFFFTIGCRKGAETSENREAEVRQGHAAFEKKVFEQDKDKDGVTDLRIETHMRGNTKAFVRMARRLPTGEWSVTHSYLLSGKIVSMEEDKDGDGFFETLLVFDPSSKDFEVFSRQMEGAIVVGSADLKENYRKIFQSLDEFWDRAPGTTNNKAAEKLISETKEKINSEAEKIQHEHNPVKKEKPPTNVFTLPSSKAHAPKKH